MTCWKSYRRNVGGKATQLKKGHKLIPSKMETYSEDDSSSSVIVINRPKSQVFKDAVKVQPESFLSHNTEILPTKVGPEKQID